MQRQIDDAYSRWLLAGSILLIWLGISCLFSQLGYARTWHLWGVPVLLPSFADFRILPGVADTLRLGLDPRIANPGDPLGRVFNYPTIWYFVAYTGITQGDTGWLVITSLVLFFVCIVSFPGRLQRRDVPLLLGIVFSPAAMLLYERGNVDIMMFVLCVCALFASRYWRTAALVIVLIGAALKMFPLFGLAIYLKETGRRFAIVCGTACLAFGAYMVGSYESFRGAWRLTQRGADLSYGAHVIAVHYERGLTFASSSFGDPVDLAPVISGGPYFIALGIVAICTVYSFRKRLSLPIGDQRSLDAFRMGAAIYIGTFLLGNNWDYRLVFLVLTIPQIAGWSRSAEGDTRRLARWTLALTYLSCWYLVIRKMMTTGVAFEMLFLVDEAANWALFVSLLCLICLSAPTWLRTAWVARSNAAQ